MKFSRSIFCKRDKRSGEIVDCAVFWRRDTTGMQDRVRLGREGADCFSFLKCTELTEHWFQIQTISR